MQLPVVSINVVKVEIVPALGHLPQPPTGKVNHHARLGDSTEQAVRRWL
jgi:hypothetical protein